MRHLYISDLHLDHYAVMRCERKEFDNCATMDEFIVAQWNSVVRDSDTVWVVGDVCHKLSEPVYNRIKAMKGTKHLLIGNHDNVSVHSDYYGLFDYIAQYTEFRDEGQHVCLFHYPIESWNRKVHGSVHIHGHVHGNTWDHAKLPNRYNAWCAGQDFSPKPLDYYKEREGFNPFIYKRMAQGEGHW